MGWQFRKLQEACEGSNRGNCSLCCNRHLSRKGAQEILSYSSSKVNNYTNIPWRNPPHALCCEHPMSPVPPPGEIWQPWLLPTSLTTQRALSHRAPGYSSLSSWGVLPCLHLTLKQKLSIHTSCDKGKQQINPKGSGRKACFSVNCCINNLRKCTGNCWEKQNSALWLFQHTELAQKWWRIWDNKNKGEY